jgi:ribosomal protein S25
VGKLVTISTLSEKFKINGYNILIKLSSLARRVLKHFTEKGVLEVVGDTHHSHTLYTVSAAALATVKTEKVDTKGQQAAKGKKGGK